MCGIVGLYQRGKEQGHLLKKMSDSMAHRGPDGEGFFRHNGFGLGHRRLAIIDLEGGEQPIFNESKTLAVVFNGEIYNYQELRRELIAKGHQFSTQTDTEVLVHLFEEEHIKGFSKLNGIFAFALLDIQKEELYLVRDPMGVKPLHYYHKEGLFLFGSEQKSILLHPDVPRALNPQALHYHLNLRYTQGEETLFQGIRRVKPGHWVCFSPNTFTEKPFQPFRWAAPNMGMSEGEAIEGIHYYLKQAVQRQLVSDVPIGVYLSGGLDSSTIVQKMRDIGVSEINTFTLGFNEPTDEFPEAQATAKMFHTQHHTHSLSLEPLDSFEKTLWYAEEPKINLLQGYHMAAFVKEKVKVVLGGLGGDELLSGYDIHRYIYPTNLWHQRIPAPMKQIMAWKSRLFCKIQSATGRMEWDEYRRGIQLLFAVGNIMRYYLILRNVWDDDNHFYQNIYSPDFLNEIRTHHGKTRQLFEPLFKKNSHLSPLDAVFAVEMESKMINDYLLTDDRMSMSGGVEERVPFLDKDLVHFCQTIPWHLKIQRGQTKSLFRKAMTPYLPHEVIHKKKWGFTVNPYLQFKKDLKCRAEEVLTEQRVREQGIFNYNYLQKIMKRPAHPKLRWHYNFLWIVLGIALWEDQFIKRPIV